MKKNHRTGDVKRKEKKNYPWRRDVKEEARSGRRIADKIAESDISGEVIVPEQNKEVADRWNWD